MHERYGVHGARTAVTALPQRVSCQLRDTSTDTLSISKGTGISSARSLDVKARLPIDSAS